MHKRVLEQLIRRKFEADEGVWSESLSNWNVRGTAASGDQDAADPRNVVARVGKTGLFRSSGCRPLR
jgi:hypothetical protein